MNSRIKVLYISRNKSLGYSILRVFAPVIDGMRDYCDVDTISLPFASNSLFNIVRNIKYVKKYVNKGKYDVLHITGPEHYLLPFLFKYNTVVTVHDLGRYYNIHKLRKFAYWIKQILPLVFAKQIVAISEIARKEIIDTTLIEEKNIIIIPDCLSEDYHFNYKPINVNKPRILHIGTGAHKNLTKTIHAINSIPCHLVIIGKLSREDVETLKNNNIEFTNKHSLSDEEILEEYRLADIINFPSLHEGFGMPIVEGQAIGRPVVTSSIEPMKSVAGSDGASFCNPMSITSIKDAYLSILLNKEFTRSIITAGLDNVKKYRKGNCVKQYFTLYKEVSK